MLIGDSMVRFNNIFTNKMTHYKMLLVELYIELMRRSCERQRFSYFARMGTLMEQYRETRY